MIYFKNNFVLHNKKAMTRSPHPKFRNSSWQKWPYIGDDTPSPLRRYVIIEMAPYRSKQIQNLAVDSRGCYINLLQLICSDGIYLSVWCLTATLCGICLREWYILMRNWAEFIYKELAKEVLINIRRFLQIFLIAAEISSQTNKRCLIFIGIFS